MRVGRRLPAASRVVVDALRALARATQSDTARARADAELAVRLDPGYPSQAAAAVVQALEGDIISSRVRIDRMLREVVDSLHPDPTVGVFVS